MRFASLLTYRRRQRLSLLDEEGDQQFYRSRSTLVRRIVHLLGGDEDELTDSQVLIRLALYVKHDGSLLYDGKKVPGVSMIGLTSAGGQLRNHQHAFVPRHAEILFRQYCARRRWHGLLSKCLGRGKRRQRTGKHDCG